MGLFFTSLCLIYACLLGSVSAKEPKNRTTELNVLVPSINKDSRIAYDLMAENFENLNPDIHVRIRSAYDEKLKKDLGTILATRTDIDVVSWHAGIRLEVLIQNNQVQALTNFWKINKLDQKFTSKLKESVSFNNNVYAVPVMVANWSFFYKKSLFQRLNLTPPKTWQEFHAVLAVIKNAEIDPIIMRSGSLYHAGVWFEYLNLRINGKAFHQQFVRGEISGDSPKLRLVLSEWEKLINQGYFHVYDDIHSTLPLLYRELLGVILGNSSVETSLPISMKNQIGTFPFPKMNPSVKNVAVAPVDAFFIHKKTKHQAAAERFLRYLTEKKTQLKLSQHLYHIPANYLAGKPSTPLLEKIQQSLWSSDDLTFFYDREVEKQYGLDNMAIWVDFVKKHDVDKAAKQMEIARQAYLLRK